MLEKVMEFNKKFGLPMADKPMQMPFGVGNVKYEHFKEELHEWATAYQYQDLEGQLDALVDLVYVTLGVVCASGFQDIFEEAFNRVHEKNMQKIKVIDPNESKRNTIHDVRKPKGWTPASFKDLIHPKKSIQLDLFGDSK